MTTTYKTKKIWGREIQIAEAPSYGAKKLIVKKGKRSSLHYHDLKEETFYLVKGRVLVEYQDGESKIRKKILSPGKTITIRQKNHHRFNGLENSVIFEVSGQAHDHFDTYRIEEAGSIPKEIMQKYYRR